MRATSIILTTCVVALAAIVAPVVSLRLPPATDAAQALSGLETALSLPQHFFSALASLIPSKDDTARPPATAQTFTLRQAYHKGTYLYPDLVAQKSWGHHASPPTYSDIRTVKQRIIRPRYPQAYIEARGRSFDEVQCANADALEWDDVDIDAPDVSHRPTLLALAQMASQAYENDTSKWEGAGGFNVSEPFGWVEDGIRGHVFATTDNSTIVVALKGTSAALLPGGGDTAKRDKTNDNLLFSCCCARVSWTWQTVCDCYGGSGYNCGQTCVERALIEKSVYYPAVTDLYNNISYNYPDAQIWITGHSLGGALSSLLGMTFGTPTVTFEAPGERMAAQRLHLPLPPSSNPDESPIAALPITHVYHTGDPIAMGSCVGTGSACALAGYAMESRCHTGKSIVYDTVGKLGWSEALASHRIATVLELLSEDWDKQVHRKRGDGKFHARGDRLRVKGIWKWPWRSGGEQDDKDEVLGEVPAKHSEDSCKDCSDWHFSDPES